MLACLRNRNWTFQRKGKRNEIYRLRGEPDRINLPINNLLPEVTVRIVLGQAGLTAEEVEQFLKDADTRNSR